MGGGTVFTPAGVPAVVSTAVGVAPFAPGVVAVGTVFTGDCAGTAVAGAVVAGTVLTGEVGKGAFEVVAAGGGTVLSGEDVVLVGCSAGKRGITLGSGAAGTVRTTAR